MNIPEDTHHHAYSSGVILQRSDCPGYPESDKMIDELDRTSNEVVVA
jgi:hypothetical protein